MPPKAKHLCSELCKHGRKEKGDDMLRCCICAEWFHFGCVGLNSSEVAGFWTCMDCRQMGPILKGVSNAMDTLTMMVTNLTTKLNNAVEARQQDVKKLTEDNTQLRQTVAELSKQITKLTWTTFRKHEVKDDHTPTSTHVLVGDSIIRDVCQTKLDNTMVVCKPDACITNIKSEVDKLSAEYEEITLVVGGNDCDSKHPVPAADIVKAYNELITAAKTHAKKVTVSGVPPRLTSDKTQATIDSVNAGLTGACADNEVTFIDTNQAFKLQDGSINDGYLMTDGVHLTRAATNKLAKCIQLRIKDKAEGVCRDLTKQRSRIVGKNSTKPRQTTPKTQDTREHHDTEDWTEVRHHKRNQRRTHEIQCYYCGEEGHVQNNCRHGKPVKCHTCHRSGHKAKLCHKF